MLNDVFSNNEQPSLPSVGDYLKGNPTSHHFSVATVTRVEITNVGSPESSVLNVAGPVSSTLGFSSLKQFNEAMGDARYWLALKKMTGEFMTLSEQYALTCLNEIYRSLLVEHSNDDDKFLGKFVKEFGIFNGETAAHKGKGKVRSRK